MMLARTAILYLTELISFLRVVQTVMIVNRIHQTCGSVVLPLTSFVVPI